jgi:hypothetical protein
VQVKIYLRKKILPLYDYESIETLPLPHDPARPRSSALREKPDPSVRTTTPRLSIRWRLGPLSLD